MLDNHKDSPGILRIIARPPWDSVSKGPES